MKMLAPASQEWLWALNKAAVLWLVLITANFNINIILIGRFHIFQECKSKLELTRIWTLGFSFFFFFVPVSRQSGAQEKNSAARASAPNVELGADPEWGLCWLMPSPPPLPHHTWVPQPLWEELLTAPSLGETGPSWKAQVSREAPQDVLLLGDLRSQQGPVARAGREWWTGVETQGTWPQKGFCGVLGRGWWCSNYELS